MSGSEGEGGSESGIGLTDGSAFGSGGGPTCPLAKCEKYDNIQNNVGNCSERSESMYWRNSPKYYGCIIRSPATL